MTVGDDMKMTPGGIRFAPLDASSRVRERDDAALAARAVAALAAFTGQGFCSCGAVEFMVPAVPCCRVGGMEHSPAGCRSIMVCEECKQPCDADGYCGPCATKAVEEYRASHGGRGPAEEFGLRRSVQAEALAALLVAARDAWVKRDEDSLMVLGNRLLRYEAARSAPPGGGA